MNWEEIKKKFTRKTSSGETDRLDCTVLYSTLQEYLQKQENENKNKLLTEIDKIIVKQMVKYANTRLDERKNAYDELYVLRTELDKLKVVV